MFRTIVRNGSENSYRYVKSANGSESWTPRYRTSNWDQEMRTETVRIPANKMVARNDWPCKFVGCGDRTVVAGSTVIVKRDGKWGHESCPVAQVEIARKSANVEIDADDLLDAFQAQAEQTVDADSLLDEYLAIRDRADDLLAEFAAQAGKSRRAANVAALQVGTYRVEFSGRRDTDSYNLKITKDRKNENAFYFKSAESYEGVGRIWADGSIQLWTNSDLSADEQNRAVEALEILLGSERLGKYGEAYARETGQCFRCGRELKVEDSIDRGLGKTCAARVEEGY